MDSYTFHFERMSNVDLHPLSLPVNRLSPAKSNSSLADQLAHHQHGKGDSAYSSFSGGSTAPDYPSPFLPDDLQSNSFSQYADLKYVKSIYNPTQVLQSDSKTMDQLYRSVEAISQQYRNNTSIRLSFDNRNGNDSFHTNNKIRSKQEAFLRSPTQVGCPPVRPPPIPARLDSFIAIKNLENSRVHHGSTDIQPQQPEPQQPRLHMRHHSQSYGPNALRPEKAIPEKSNLNLNSDPVYSVWRGSQQPQAQEPPSYQPHEQTGVVSNPEYFSVTDNKAASQQQTPANTLNQSQTRSIHLEHRKLSSGGACNGEHHNKPNGHFESQRKRSHSAHDWLGSETSRAASPWRAGQSLINSSIQHKGQFYFVTGVCKPSEAAMRPHSGTVCGSDVGSGGFTGPEKYQLREKERCHSTMDNFFTPFQDGVRISSGCQSPDEGDVFNSVSPCKDLSAWSQDQENQRLSLSSAQSSQSFDAFEETHSRDIGRHTASNPIFYCGPDNSSSPKSTSPDKELASLINNEQAYHHKREEPVKKGTRQPLGDVASERINKETTPLLYHLTGASRAALQPKKKADFSVRGKETTGNLGLGSNERPPKSDASNNNRGEENCNTLDDSFKKYYKEKLKDAQSKVLRETSFKRRDLQLSWPHRIRQKPELRPTVVHNFSPSQDSEASTDTLTPSVASEETETGSIKELVRESVRQLDKEAEKENGRQINMAQPQVARIGCRKRLTPEQKKMCYSEPEKLHQLGSAPSHSSCRSFGNESDSVFLAECEEENYEQQGEQGLVATRRQMFETKGRALSAPSASKSNLKHLQHKALVEYMVRKTGQKVAEPQQPSPLIPPPSRQRHSLGEKPFDWAPAPGNHEEKNTKKRLHRPHSAGRILDSSTSSVRYAQFFSAQSCSGQYALQSGQPRWREGHGASHKRSASVESLLDQPEQPHFLRNRSTSTPQTLEDLQACDGDKNPLPDKPQQTRSPQKNSPEDPLIKPAAQGQQPVRVVAQRGKSMEELGASKLTRLPALSRSSEQLDQLWRDPSGPGAADRHKRNAPLFAEVRDAQGRDKNRERKKDYVMGQGPKMPEAVALQNPHGQTQNPTQKRSVSRQDSEPAEEASSGARNSSRSTSPASSHSSSRARVQSGSAADVSGRRPSNSSSNPPSPRVQEPTETEIRSSRSSPTQSKLPCENRPGSSVATSPGAGSEREQSLDKPRDEALPPEANREVSLSCGVTTDPSLWILPPEEEAIDETQTSPLPDNVFDDESTGLTAPTQKRETAVSPCTSISDKDKDKPAEEEVEEGKAEVEDEKSEEDHETEEKESQAGETESLEKPSERPQWEELVKAVVTADQSLARVLYPLAKRKTALMLMEQLLSEDTLLMEEHYKKKQELRGAAESVEEAEPSPDPAAPNSLQPQCPDPQSKADIAEKKRLLVSLIESRLRSLEGMRALLQTEMEENVAHGKALETLVRERCLPVELERYILFIGDLERVVSLLLCLSARLARVQNALSTVDQHTDAEEKQSLDSRHRLLCKQREDAKDLKDNLDRRENMVSTFLSRQLSAEQLHDYRRFVQTKASLLIRQKDLEEKQRLAEEQLEALANSVNL